LGFVSLVLGLFLLEPWFSSPDEEHFGAAVPVQTPQAGFSADRLVKHDRNEGLVPDCRLQNALESP